MKLNLKILCVVPCLVSGLVVAEERIAGLTDKAATQLFKSEDGLDIAVDDKKKQATLSVSRQIDKQKVFKMDVIGKFDGKDTVFANEEGLSNDVTLKLSLTDLFLREQTNDLDSDLALLEKASLSAKMLKDARLALYRCAIISLKPTDIKLEDSYKDMKGYFKDKGASYYPPNCNEKINNVAAVKASTNNIKLYNEYDYFKYGATYSPGSYKYFDLEKGANQTSSTESYSVDLEYGAITLFGFDGTKGKRLAMDASKFAFGASIGKGDSKEETSKTNLCGPIEGADTYNKCFDAYLKPAYENSQFKLYASYAYRAQDAFIKGLDFTISYQATKKKYADDRGTVDVERLSVDLPLTLFVTESLGAKAGISLHWKQRHKTDDSEFSPFSLGLFVTKGFELSSK